VRNRGQLAGGPVPAGRRGARAGRWRGPAASRSPLRGGQPGRAAAGRAASTGPKTRVTSRSRETPRSGTARRRRACGIPRAVRRPARRPAGPRGRTGSSSLKPPGPGPARHPGPGTGRWPPGLKEASSSARNSRRAVSARKVARSAGASNSGTRLAQAPVRSGTWAAEASSVSARLHQQREDQERGTPGPPIRARPSPGPPPSTVPNVPGSSSSRSSAAGSPRQPRTVPRTGPPDQAEPSSVRSAVGEIGPRNSRAARARSIPDVLARPDVTTKPVPAGFDRLPPGQVETAGHVPLVLSLERERAPGRRVPYAFTPKRAGTLRPQPAGPQWPPSCQWASCGGSVRSSWSSSRSRMRRAGVGQVAGVPPAEQLLTLGVDDRPAGACRRGPRNPRYPARSGAAAAAGILLGLQPVQQQAVPAWPWRPGLARRAARRRPGPPRRPRRSGPAGPGPALHRGGPGLPWRTRGPRRPGRRARPSTRAIGGET